MYDRKVAPARGKLATAVGHLLVLGCLSSAILFTAAVFVGLVVVLTWLIDRI